MKQSDLKLQTVIKWSLLVGGLLCTLIGTGHIFMPTLGYSAHLVQNMPPEVSDHFYYLGTYAICSFLLGFGIISIYLSSVPFSTNTLVISFVLTMIWISRAMMEFIYPVELKIFMLDAPHSVLAVIITFLAILYSMAVICGYLLLKKQKINS